MAVTAAPERFFVVGGTLRPEARSYVQRAADRELLEHAAAGEFCYVLTPRQMGKSSLMERTAIKLRKKNSACVIIDLQGMIERGMTAEAFYASLVEAFVRQIDLPLTLGAWWEERSLLSPVRRFSNFLAEEVAPRIGDRLVVFIDEIDQTLELECSDGFFAALRACYNARARVPGFNALTFVLLGVASPQHLIKNRAQSPFNIGHRIELGDFTLAESRLLAEGLPLDLRESERLIERVLEWTGGQPYLTQRVCAALVSDARLREGVPCVDALVKELFLSDATWSDPNLAGVRDRIVEHHDSPAALLALYRRIRTGEQIYHDERSPLQAALKLSGLVKVIPGGVLRPRNRIYEAVFTDVWVDSQIRPLATTSEGQRERKDGVLMEPIARIVTALAFGAVAANSEVAEKAVKDAYAGLKALALHKFAGKGEVEAAIRFMEQRPDSEGRKTALAEELAAAGAGNDGELARTAQALLDLLQSGGLLRTESYQATMIGSGAVAQGAGAVAAGEGGVAIAGNVYGSVYTGRPPRDPEEALGIYCRVLVETGRDLSLRGLDVGASDPTGQPTRFDLLQVYIDLLTTRQAPQEEARPLRGRQENSPQEPRTLSALEAAASYRRMVLLGDPGSGKSTFITNFTLALALHRLDPAHGWLDRLRDWPPGEARLLPITVVLRDFTAASPAVTVRATPSRLWDFIVARLDEQNLSFAARLLEKQLERGQAIVFLDGLDEIGDPRQRVFVREAVQAFAGRYPRSRMVVTCRTLAYQKPAWQLEGFEPVTLAPFSKEQVDRFVAGWYRELARLGGIKSGAIATVTRNLQSAVRRTDLWRLATNPLLLTVMALVHTHKGQLPDARALLYEETLDILLWRWEQVKISGRDEPHRLRALLVQASRTDVDLKRALWHLAYDTHAEGSSTGHETVADISEARLQKVLVELHPDRSRDWAYEVVQVMCLRAGLLLERAPSVYTFPHRTFQEYLAGAYLSVQPDFARRAARLVEQATYWREVVLLAVGRLVYLNGETAKPLELVAELCPARLEPTERISRAGWFAGEVLLEMGLNRVQESALGRDLAERVCTRLVALLEAGALGPVERAEAGRVLARLGDPRAGVTGVAAMEFCWVAPGAFWMGEGKEARLNDGPGYGYWMGRYPVTHAQFKVFVDAGGYRDPRYWREAAGQGVWKPTGEVQARWDDAARSGPHDSGFPYTLENHPVVGVNWYEALAFTRWLTEHLHREQRLPQGYAVRLPSEAEWEKAARGGVELPAEPLIRAVENLAEDEPPPGRVPNPEPKRRYPWGAETEPERANYDATRVGSTSAVGCFPLGTTPYGCQDMAGNCWEWTRSLWQREEKDGLAAGIDIPRAWCGGAFYDVVSVLHSASRSWHDPDVRHSYLGFRVVVSPSTSGL